MKTNTKNWTAKETANTADTPATGKVHNLLIVDESGSMGSLYDLALSGMNETLQSIKTDSEENPETRHEVTLVTFDTEHYNEIFKSTPGKEIRTLTRADYRPCGCTPLYDAVGRAVSDLRGKVTEGDTVLVTIITDGLENASCEYTVTDIKNMIETLSKQGWLFTYIGANQDAVTVGKTMSINASMSFDFSHDGMSAMWDKERNARKRYYNNYRESGYHASEQMDNANFF